VVAGFAGSVPVPEGSALTFVGEVVVVGVDSEGLSRVEGWAGSTGD
jgi:hypothetical protein